MSSKRRIRRNACTGKVRHATAADGAKAIYDLNRGLGYRGRMNCYRCKFCNGFHIGHAKAAR